nr:hypothetical protein CFP56_28655 [Quercus suber]
MRSGPYRIGAAWWGYTSSGNMVVSVRVVTRSKVGFCPEIIALCSGTVGRTDRQVRKVVKRPAPKLPAEGSEHVVAGSENFLCQDFSLLQALAFGQLKVPGTEMAKR